MTRCRLFITTTLLLLCLGQKQLIANSQTISPVHVYQQAQIVEQRLQAIAKHIGKPTSATPTLRVRKAQPREVFFQAQTLLDLTTQLNHEIKSQQHLHNQSTYKPHAQIKPKDVLELVNKANMQLVDIETQLKIPPLTLTPAIKRNIAPTDVYNLLLRINTHTNELLDTSITTTNVYSALTYAMHLTSDLIPPQKKIKRYPNTNASSLPANPSQLLKKVLGCYQLLQKHAKAQKQSILSLELNKHKITRKEVILTANIITQAVIAELFYLNYANNPNFSAPYPLYQANYKTVGETVERAQALLNMLQTLQSKQRNGAAL